MLEESGNGLTSLLQTKLLLESHGWRFHVCCTTMATQASQIPEA